MIKYLGSKRTLIPHIRAAVGAIPDVRSVLDLFSGTSRVGHALKQMGQFVIANDQLTFPVMLARCYVEADAEVYRGPAERLIADLARVPPRPGYFTETFCERARFFQPKNGARIDAIRDAIANLDLDPVLEAIALTSLMEAADRVDSTTGVQMAYLKQWAQRSHNDLELRVPELVPGSGRAMQGDASTSASTEVDLAYLDPPYNQHRYIGNYHVWETLVRWDAPEHYGVACKRIECRDHKSDFNSKRRILEAFEQVIQALRCKHILVSFSNEGYIAREELEQLLSTRGEVGVVDIDFKRYVGAQIGIFNPSGKRVGRVSHLRNKEHLFVVSEQRKIVGQVVDKVRQELAS